MLPQEEHGSGGRCPQDPQYQSCPERWKDRRCLPHRAQHGGEIAVAPRGAQRDQQLADDPRCRGPAICQHRGTAGQGEGEAA